MCQGSHWINIDGSPNVILDNMPVLKKLLYPFLPASSKKDNFVGCVYMDLRGKWKFEDSSVDAIYSSHVYEHLNHEDGLHFLQEAFRVLKPEGKLRLVVPSIKAEIDKYLALKAKGDLLAASKLSQILEIFPAPVQGPWWYKLIKRLYDKNTHKWFYDDESMLHYLTKAGFDGIQTKKFLETSIAHLDEIEHWYKVSDSVCLEAKKPACISALLKKAA